MKTSRMILDSVKCDICSACPEEIIDAPTMGGKWGYMCDACYQLHGATKVSLGSRHKNRPQPKADQPLSFEAWMHATDRIFEAKVGLDIDSILGDWNSRDMFDDGMTPSEAARELTDNVRSEYGAEYV